MIWQRKLVRLTAVAAVMAGIGFAVAQEAKPAAVPDEVWKLPKPQAQNVYLYCAAEGLAVVVRAWFDPEALGAALKLGPDQKVILAQTVGYPGKGGQ